MTKVQDVWNRACGYLKESLSKDTFDRWISVIEPQQLTDESLTLRVANNFYQTWLEENYLPLIQDALSTTCGCQMTVSFAVDASARVPEKAENAEAPAVKTPAKSRSRALQALDPKYTFESFVVGPSNSFSHGAAIAVANAPGRAYNPMLIYGRSGLGKTHLLHAIGNHVQKHSTLSVCYVTSETFVNEYIDAMTHNAFPGFRRKYRKVDVLLLDDVHFLATKERMQEEFFHTFNDLFNAQKQIVMTSDRPASEIAGLEHRLVTRLEWGLVTEIEQPDVETRIAILRNKQKDLKVQLPDDIINYLAENIRSNIRRLEGAFIRVVSYTSLTGRAINRETLENLLRDTLDQTQTAPLTPEEIQKIVADFYNIRMSDLTGNRRPQEISLPRQVAMFLCREHTRLSLPSIGSSFNRNHATVIHACTQIKSRIKNDSIFRQTLTSLTHKLSQRA